MTADTASTSADQAARAWRAGLPHERRRSTNLRGGLLFGINAIFWVGLFVGGFLLPTWWMRALCLLGNPLAIGGLFVIGHDAAHNSLTRTGWLNRLIGRLAMLPAWHPYTSWCQAHNTLHHGGTTLKGRHPDFPPFSKEEFDRLPAWRRVLERVYRNPLGIGLFYTIDFYFLVLLFPKKAQRSPFAVPFHLDRLLIAAFFALQLGVGYWLTGYAPDLLMPRWVVTLAGVLVPWTTWIWFMGFVSFLQHTHPRIAWYDDPDEWSFYHVQLRSTTHVTFPWPIERLLNNIMDHPAHHIDPTIPLYELPASQRLLEERTPEHSVVVPWSVREYLRICRCCKLYDYRRHCWLDFAGNPTTPEGLNRVPEEARRAVQETA
jgi:omega-6 fatty acid desaturase (delta-12 desaturase)